MKRMLLFAVASLLLVAGMVMGVLAIAANRRSEASAGSATSAEVIQQAASAKSDAGWMKEYTLTERSGKKFHSKDLAGQVHVVNFFFAKCPTVCRVQTGAVAGLHREFGPKGVKFLSITVDPENDTPVALAEYAKEFQADPEQWLFLTGDLAYLRRVGAEMYFLPVDKQTHSESLLVLDGDGKIQGRFSWKDAGEVAKMKALLNELLAKYPPSDQGSSQASAE